MSPSGVEASGCPDVEEAWADNRPLSGLRDARQMRRGSASVGVSVTAGISVSVGVDGVKPRNCRSFGDLNSEHLVVFASTSSRNLAQLPLIREIT